MLSRHTTCVSGCNWNTACGRRESDPQSYRTREAPSEGAYRHDQADENHEICLFRLSPAVRGGGNGRPLSGRGPLSGTGPASVWRPSQPHSRASMPGRHVVRDALRTPIDALCSRATQYLCALCRASHLGGNNTNPSPTLDRCLAGWASRPLRLITCGTIATSGLVHRRKTRSNRPLRSDITFS